MKKSPSISKGNKTETEYPEFKGFVNFSLTEKEKQAGQKWVSEVDFLDQISRIVLEAYKLSLSLDKNDRFIASLSTKHGVNKGWVLTARGSSWDVAAGRALYLHIVIFDGTWMDREISGDDW